MSALGTHTATMLCMVHDDLDEAGVAVHEHTSDYGDGIIVEYVVMLADQGDSMEVMLTADEMYDLADQLDDALYMAPTDDEKLRALIVDAEFIARIEQAYHDDAHAANSMILPHVLAGKLADNYDLFSSTDHGAFVELRFDTLFQTGNYITINRNNGQGMHADAVMARQGARYIVQIMEAPSEQAVDTASTADADRQQSENAMLRRVQISVNS